MDYRLVRGFNYQPSYGSNGFELWRKFDAATIRIELGRGKRFFPRMNAIRLWLSWDAFVRDPVLFERQFDQTLAIAAEYGLVVMPVLFNRWHDTELDYGGIYLDHFLPGSSWIQQGDLFGPYMETIVGGHARDPRVFAWDLCNEPFAYLRPVEEIPEIVEAEFAWLQSLYRRCKVLGAQAPITVGIHSGHRMAGIRQIEPISDLLSIHPYYTDETHPGGKPGYEALLDEYVAFAREVGKPLLATETCWGAVDDAKRVRIVRYTLGELAKREIGWLVYLLHHSLIADAHRPEFGPVGGPGNLAFIEADGTLRPGHDVFNEF